MKRTFESFIARVNTLLVVWGLIDPQTAASNATKRREKGKENETTPVLRAVSNFGLYESARCFVETCRANHFRGLGVFPVIGRDRKSVV